MPDTWTIITVSVIAIVYGLLVLVVVGTTYLTARRARREEAEYDRLIVESWLQEAAEEDVH